MVMHGFETTVPVTLDMMILQGHAVMRGSKRALVVVNPTCRSRWRIRPPPNEDQDILKWKSKLDKYVEDGKINQLESDYGLGVSSDQSLRPW